mmetsp:Transcript_11611/g.21277  ORF Transcript_11611/g.21277 Transcript_11611/m.21277 type:complete len:224 (-) Transcript_11611:972-1643(-)
MSKAAPCANACLAAASPSLAPPDLSIASDHFPLHLDTSSWHLIRLAPEIWFLEVLKINSLQSGVQLASGTGPNGVDQSGRLGERKFNKATCRAKSGNLPSFLCGNILFKMPYWSPQRGESEWLYNLSGSRTRGNANGYITPAVISIDRTSSIALPKQKAPSNATPGTLSMVQSASRRSSPYGGPYALVLRPVELPNAIRLPWPLKTMLRCVSMSCPVRIRGPL